MANTHCPNDDDEAVASALLFVLTCLVRDTRKESSNEDKPPFHCRVNVRVVGILCAEDEKEGMDNAAAHHVVDVDVDVEE
mmetsp:Transcript_29892/g.54770  ORF Transcript_29892/g.54770 Transcript_29892/m.54770 type:complete len:80 (-) Transcript_29892:387-626(-)